jgi:methylenetetrahydrofolate--tRNA-(uracil-5-)-methyltransferase
MVKRVKQVTVVGGGLAGSEAAWQIAEIGYEVLLYEMRPGKTTGAHVSDRLAELVCSNSMGSALPDRASGLLQQELKMLGSLLIQCAEDCAVPAGGALAVDRELFANRVTERIQSHPRIQLRREELPVIPQGPTILATGPLTSNALASDIGRFAGQEYLYFYDAISPIVVADTIDMKIAFTGSRYGRGQENAGDYINCPMTQEEYSVFVRALVDADQVVLRDFERETIRFFEGCLPIEELARRGDNTLAFGPMRPIGLRDPRTGRRPYAVVQLRRDNIAGSLYNIVGFQTNLRWGDQERVLRLIPGLKDAEFVRMGQMHRNTFINSPALLYPTMQSRQRDDLFFAGQITGVEGYVGNIATGLIAGINISRYLSGYELITLPNTTMLGALCHYITHADSKAFQPMKANFGILRELPEPIRDKRQRAAAFAARSAQDLQRVLVEASDKGLQTETIWP